MTANELFRDELSQGVLKLADGRVIARPRMTLQELAASVGPTWRPWPGTDDEWYDLANVVIGGRRCGAGVRVHNGAVRSVLIVAAEPETPPWHAALEKKKHDEWLLAVFGYAGPYAFPWGEITTGEDTKGGTGPIAITYGPPL